MAKLSRTALIDLAIEWLSPDNLPLCQPVLAEHVDEDEDDAPYSAADTVDDIQQIYQDLRDRKGGKKEVVDRVLEGDWRNGITLYQLAMAETRYLLEHPNALRWNALEITPHVPKDAASTAETTLQGLPRVHGPTVLAKLAHEICPIAKIHSYLTHIKTLNAMLLRILIHDSPYSTQKSLQALHSSKSGFLDEPKTLYLLFPDGTPYVHVSMTSNASQYTGADGRSLRSVMLDAVAVALSRKGARYALKSTNFSSKSLDTLLAIRGAGRKNFAQGGWSIFVDESCNPASLDYRSKAIPKALESTSGNSTPKSLSDGKAKRQLESESVEDITSSAKRRRAIAQSRFGNAGLQDDGMPIERLDVRITDPFPVIAPASASTTNAAKSRGRSQSRPPIDASTAETDINAKAWTPNVRLTFHGTHIFAGIRSLVEQGKINGERLPGWMTGEAGVSVGVVKQGKISKGRQEAI